MGGGPASTARGTSGDRVTRRIDVGYPEDRDRAEERLDELRAEDDDAKAEGDEAVVDN